MRAEKLCVGMVGAGSWARRHLEVWGNTDGAQVVAIYNRTRSKAEGLAHEFEIPDVCSDLDELIQREDVNVISIALPPHLHHPVSIAAIDAGKHVFCEKPLAVNYRQAKEMWERAERAGVKTGVQFGHRFSPSMNRLRDLLREGYVGEIQYFEAKRSVRLFDDPAFPLVWRFKKDVAGAGALADLGVYMIDWARWLIGEFAAVSGSVRTYIKSRPVLLDGHNFQRVLEMARNGALPVTSEMGTVDNDDECIFLATFENGVHGFLRTSRIHDDRSLRVCGSQGVVMLEGREGKLLGKRHGEAGFSEIPVPQGTVPATVLTPFVASIRNDTDLPPTFYDGMKAQQVIDAVLRSAKEGRWVSLSQSHENGG